MKVTPSSYAWVCDNTYHTDSPYRLFEQRKIPPPGASQYTKLGENSTLSEAEDRGCNVPWGFVCLSCKVHPIRIEDDRFVSDYSLNMIPPYDCNPPLQGFRFCRFWLVRKYIGGSDAFGPFVRCSLRMLIAFRQTSG